MDNGAILTMVAIALGTLLGKMYFERRPKINSESELDAKIELKNNEMDNMSDADIVDSIAKHGRIITKPKQKIDS